MDVIRAFAEKAKLSHPILRSADIDGDGKEDTLGSEVAYDSFGVLGYPTSFWIDHTGRIVGREVGFDASHFPAMEKRVEKLLAARPAGK